VDAGEAARMLLAGATLAAQPCPYCGGVRVIKDGDAFCTGCGSAPAEGPARPGGAAEALEKSIGELSLKVAAETDGARRAELVASIDQLCAALERLRKTG